MSSFPVEYQDWLLLIITFGFFAIVILPFYLTGLPTPAARKLGQHLQAKLLAFYTLAFVANFVFLLLVLAILPDWNVGQYFEWVGIGLAEIGVHLNVFASSGLILFAFFLLFIMRERIKILLGIENQVLVRFSMKDVYACCGLGTSERPIEVYVFKVEELSASSIMKTNDLFVELSLASNERVRTRVHKSAGSGAVLKECLQLNFDPTEEEDKLHITCRSQDLLGSSEIGSLELSSTDVKSIIEMDDVQQFKLFPQGKIWLSIVYVDEEEDDGVYRNGETWKWRRLLNAC
ncbi:unnamed protein product [Amoebophrya sp. A120]|nr:unnamed protein product [Amoebophrya sp. A120]|eukprot:GSA120T00015657001.1